MTNPVKNHALSPNVRGARLPDLSGPLFSHLGHFAHPEIVEQGHNPAVSEKQRIAMAIAEHEPEKLYKRNRGMKKMSHKQLHDFASKEK